MNLTWLFLKKRIVTCIADVNLNINLLKDIIIFVFIQKVVSKIQQRQGLLMTGLI